MVVIPNGQFTMGSPENESEREANEGPQHRVRISTFALAKTEVTFDQWLECLNARACSNRPEDEGWGRGDRPVVNVNWNDAQDYVQWLREKTGEDYRLPSEAEWEYAARADTTTRFNTGDCIHKSQANFDGNYPALACPRGDKGWRTMPVGSLSPNAFGLYDMHGNAEEWVADCWNDSYRGAPGDGSAWMAGDCTRTVQRGGSWNDAGRALRSAARTKNGPRDYRTHITGGSGFRPARSILSPASTQAPDTLVEDETHEVTDVQALGEPESAVAAESTTVWAVGDRRAKAHLTSTAAIPGFESEEPFELMEMFQQDIEVNGQWEEMLVLIHGKRGALNEWEERDINPAYVTVALKTGDFFKTLYTRRFAHIRGRSLDNYIFVSAELKNSVVSINYRSAEGNSIVFLNDLFSLTNSGEVVTVDIEVPKSFLPESNLPRGLEIQRAPRPISSTTRGFYRDYSVSKTTDDFCCPTGGTYTVFYNLHRSDEVVALVAQRWEHKNRDGEVVRSSGASVADSEGPPSPEIHLPFNGSSKIADQYDLRMFGGMLFDDGVSGLALDFKNERTSSPFYKKHYASIRPLNASEATVALWFNFAYSAHDHGGSLYSAGSNSSRRGNTGFRIVISHDANVWLSLIGNGEVAGTERVSIDRNRWYFVTGVIGQGQIRLYLDGEQVGSTDIDFPFSLDDLPQYLGYHAWDRGGSGSSRFTGRIDELMVFNQALESGQVKLLYDSYRDPN